MASKAMTLALPLLPFAAGINLRNGQFQELVPKVEQHGASFVSAAFQSEVDAELNMLFQGGNTTSKKASFAQSKRVGWSVLAARGAPEVDVKEAARNAPLPQGVNYLIRKSDGKKVDPQMVEKAVSNLNNQIAEAQIRLDAKNDECSEFDAKQTQTMDQINADLSRLGQEAAETARSITATLGSIDAVNLNQEQLKEEMQRELLAFTKVRTADKSTLDKQQADLDVSTFILEFTVCKDAPAASSASAASALLQGGLHSGLTSTSFKVCSNGTMEQDLVFEDPRLNAKTGQLSPEAKRVLHRFVDPQVAETMVIGEAQSQAIDREDGDSADADIEQVSFLAQPKEAAPPACDTTITQVITSTDKALCQTPAGGKVEYTGVQCEEGLIKWNVAKALDLSEGKTEEDCLFDLEKIKDKKEKFHVFGSCGVAPTALGAGALALACQVPPLEAVAKPAKAELKSANKCSAADPHCAILHDLFASLWGEMKDLVDATKAKMAADEAEWKTLEANINSQIQANAVQLGNLETTQAEATSFKNAVTEEQAGKQVEKTHTQHLWDTTMDDCKAQMREILFTEICGVSAVRNNIIAEHLPDEPSPVDCSVSEWIPGECSVECDDALRGGVHQLIREVITKNSPRGSRCPALSTSRKCNQIKCPVDCQLSKYSGWSKCTKECGGGVQGRTRTRVVEPKNGGAACDALMESQPCSTQSCDVDCDLGDWQPWAACSKSCNAGYEERNLRMIAEALGEGHCLASDAPERRERRECNTQACKGDEICNPEMDLVIAIDASGSVTEKGFDILKEFVGHMVKRMEKNVRVAIVQFGNGKLDKDKIVSDAKEITKGFVTDKKELAGAIEGLVWQQGFTNMAQAIFKAKDVLVASRPTAQSVVLVVTDGRPSFKFQTDLAVRKLRESARLGFVHIQRFRKQEMAELLKGYASDPWSNNYIHIPGKHKLKQAYEAYTTQVLGDLCSVFESPAPEIGPCSATDGTAASSAYPCICGDILCEDDGSLCAVSDSYCMPAPVKVLF